MGLFKATVVKKKANPPICWICDRKLYAGGRSYVLVSVNGIDRPVHGACADRECE